MSSKLRVLYDRLYIGVEMYIFSLVAWKDGRKYAKSVTKNPRVDQEYRTVIRSYWKQFRVRTPKKYWFTLFANQDKQFSPQYIPDNLWYRRILPYYNNLLFAKALQDKCLHNVLFPDMKRPVTVVKNIAGVFYDDALNLISQKEAAARCHDRGRILVKPSVGSSQGRNISFYDSGSLTDEAVADIFRKYGHDFIIQEKLEQHEALARLNAGSLNTCRINTFFHNGEIHILSAILRVGGGGNEVDNVSAGGYQCGIRPDGRLEEKGFTHIGGRWEYTDAYPSGIRFGDVIVPSFEKAVALVTDHAKKMSHFKIIGWDIAIDPAGEPVLVEYNIRPGQDQESNGPTFGALTDEVLTEIFGRK